MSPALLRRDVLLTTVLAAGMAAGCSGSKITTHSSSELNRYQIKTVALLPFTAIATPQIPDPGDLYLSTPQGARRSDISLGVPSSREPSMRHTVTVPDHAAEKVTHLFWNRLKNRKGVVVLSPSNAEQAGRKAANDENPAGREFAAAEAAKQLKADAAFIGQVLIYQERVGGRLGANPPATVGFEVKTVAADGQVLWVGNYYEKQMPMTQDFMGFVQHGGVFVTAEELARYGVDEILKSFPFGITED
ncbi:hypothetical protein W02_07130 [Nitrospira sp. KM1]|uniref:hypothetical protein n=1 Tax=Nitrospira sp. KM1 TaxID=1936990 RepID=UPI0013A7241E|nr:hypothetical protein [Nitrospira sp. KM1]BCA53573.1 hypothetical protein W02_07130 [Nitrospira sp. KM1]